MRFYFAHSTASEKIQAVYMHSDLYIGGFQELPSFCASIASTCHAWFIGCTPNEWNCKTLWREMLFGCCFCNHPLFSPYATRAQIKFFLCKRAHDKIAMRCTHELQDICAKEQRSLIWPFINIFKLQMFLFYNLHTAYRKIICFAINKWIFSGSIWIKNVWNYGCI